MDVTVIGAGKFAVEVAHYLVDAPAPGGGRYRVQQFLAVDDEPVEVASARCRLLRDTVPAPGTSVILAVPDAARRRTLIDDLITARGLVAENIVHPTAQVDAARLEGPGNIVGPNCYLGADVTVGAFNVLNYHCTVGHHSRLGSNNFLAPNFHCGNSIRVGDDNFFGLSCTLAPEVAVGDRNRFQAGITFFDTAGDGQSFVSPNRVKSIAAL